MIGAILILKIIIKYVYFSNKKENINKIAYARVKEVVFMHISNCIKELVKYGLKHNLIEDSDKYYIVNQYLQLLNINEYVGDIEEIKATDEKISLEKILSDILDYAYEKSIIKENSVVYRDLFDTKLMAVMVSKPSEIIRKFNENYKVSPIDAANYYYELSKVSDYIRTYRIKKDIKWTVPSKYGDIDITINLSKPEKDPKAIASAKMSKDISYPKCQLCIENEGYEGRLNHPARGNYRIIPLTINNEKWGFQYSPYVYYNEHCIVLNSKHIPMKIDEKIWDKLFDFVKLFPHYFVGSNADLPIVGGSILTHEHFQGGHYEFAMSKAQMKKTFVVKEHENVECGILNWPLSVIRLRSKDTENIKKLATHILNTWREYTDEASYIYAKTDGEIHNTITPIARKKGDFYELDLALRNNITTKEHPLGLYHPHSKLHHIKKENIGLIEVMGLAVLPARLKEELSMVAEAIVEGKDVCSIPQIAIHGEWVNEFINNYNNITKDNVMEIVKTEVGKVFVEVLEDAGVYKCNEEGIKAFERFLNKL